MRQVQLETTLEVLGLQTSDIPQVNTDSQNIYCNFSSNPVAKLYKKENGYVLRFGYAVSAESIVDPLPTGGIRVKPAPLFRGAAA